jgi:lipopolysaccharide biosynthesis glycosyltransferase
MMIIRNIDDIFDLKTPSILIYLKEKILENYSIKIDKQKLLSECSNKSISNGGIMLIEPSISIYNLLLENIINIINYKCKFPNEILFFLPYKKIYNLPFKYNSIRYYLNKIKYFHNLNMKKYVSIIHFSGTYKHVDIYKDNYLDKIKKDDKLLYYFLYKYYNKFYLKNKIKIDKLIL